MPPFFKNRPLVIVIILSFILLVTVIFTARGRNSVTGVESVIGDVVSPVQDVMYGVTTSVANFFTGAFNRRDLEKEYAKLKEQVDQLTQENRRLNELQKENERLNALLGFSQEHPEFEPIGAHVIGKDPGSWFNVLVIDKGKSHGVEKDMAVVTEKGLVGRVMEVGSNWSKVLTVIDSRSSVSGIVERTRDNGIIRGNNRLGAEDGLCQMIYLPMDTDLIPGDKVLTSGLGGIFPKGILIGEVKEVSRQKNELQKYAVIKPSVDFFHIEEVLVIKSYTEKIPVE